MFNFPIKTPILKQNLKSKLLSISSKALRLVAGDDFSLFSFKELHCMFSRATPTQWADYSNAVQLYNVINSKKPKILYQNLQNNFFHNKRTDRFGFNPTNLHKIGLNKFQNRLKEITTHLSFKDLNLSKETFKLKCKREFIL